ncbi:MAG: SurA N-terminal domain-containing protein [Alphaproteobacteria bacterium]
MIMKLDTSRTLRFIGLVFGLALFLAPHKQAFAQSIVVLVNDEPVTSYELRQRQRFLALTRGIGKRMKQRLKSPKTQEQFREFAMKVRPSSKEEMRELQKKFVQHIQKQVVAETARSSRKVALEQLIEERLMLQAAKQLKVAVSDDDLQSILKRMAQRNNKKMTVKQFLGQLRKQGIDPTTLKERVRASNSWQKVIKRRYGGQLQVEMQTIKTTSSTDKNGATVDVKIVKFAIANPKNESLVAQRLLEVEKMRKKFKSCGMLNGLLSGVKNASVRSVTNVKISKFRGEVQAALKKARTGQMTPPAIHGGAIESHAVCKKRETVASGVSKKKNNTASKLQKTFKLYSRRYLKDLKDRARIEYPNKKRSRVGG